jgi:hypothetical protein
VKHAAEMRPTGSSGLTKLRSDGDRAEEDRKVGPLVEHQSRTCNCRKTWLDRK